MPSSPNPASRPRSNSARVVAPTTRERFLARRVADLESEVEKLGAANADEQEMRANIEHRVRELGADHEKMRIAFGEEHKLRIDAERSCGCRTMRIVDLTLALDAFVKLFEKDVTVAAVLRAKKLLAPENG